MKQRFKPLGIVAAVAAASAGYLNVANAQQMAPGADPGPAPTRSVSNTGDLALVPYYTVNGEWITGVHIVNTSDKTQVVKFRFRRATDSMDALDFNVVMSPKDVYAGFLSDSEDGEIRWSANDTSCTVPGTTNGVLTMPDIYRKDAEAGYLEIIAMGQPMSETYPIAHAAKHVDDVPRSCEGVRSAFFADGSASRPGVDGTGAAPSGEAAWSRDLSDADGDDSTSDIIPNFFEDSDNALKVSYFIRDNATGIEFGDNAVHINNFLNQASITNQQFGYFSGDLTGFDFPDLNGGIAVSGFGTRGRFNALRAGDVLGSAAIFNEWTSNPANGAALSWVVTMPGQYTMFDLPKYVTDARAEDGGWAPTLSESGAPISTPECPRFGSPDSDGDPATVVPDGSGAGTACDFRDIPVELTFQAYNREEFGGSAPEEGLVVSPQPPGEIDRAFLGKEVNVVTFGGNNVLGVSDVNVNVDLRQPYGWLAASVSSRDDNIRVCDWNFDEDNQVGDASFPSAAAGAALGVACTSGLNPGVPIIGFAAWARNVAANPDASYGRIVAHSFQPGS